MNVIASASLKSAFAFPNNAR